MIDLQEDGFNVLTFVLGFFGYCISKRQHHPIQGHPFSSPGIKKQKIGKSLHMDVRKERAAIALAFSILLALSIFFLVLYIGNFDKPKFSWMGLSFCANARPFVSSTVVIVLYMSIQSICIESQLLAIITVLFSTNPHFIRASISLLIACSMVSLICQGFLYGWIVGSLVAIVFVLIGNPAVERAYQISFKVREDIVSTSSLLDSLDP
jgi:hypothetical protein